MSIGNTALVFLSLTPKNSVHIVDGGAMITASLLTILLLSDAFLVWSFVFLHIPLTKAGHRSEGGSQKRSVLRSGSTHMRTSEQVDTMKSIGNCQNQQLSLVTSTDCTTRSHDED